MISETRSRKPDRTGQRLRGQSIPCCRFEAASHGNDEFLILIRGVDLKVVSSQNEEIF